MISTTNFELDPSLQQKAEPYLRTRSKLTGLEYGQSRWKRLIDIVVSTGLLPIVLPVTLSGAYFIWHEDGHWPLTDVGSSVEIEGRRIREWKLRTMIPNAQKMEEKITQGKTLPQFKRELVKSGKRDPRVTQVGESLRKHTLDEAPQMLNVFLGHLSAVGPRLPLESDLKYIRAHRDGQPFKKFLELAGQGGRFGVTGLYTVLGRGQLSEENRWGLETLYWERQSLVSDLRIIAATIPALRRSNGK